MKIKQNAVKSSVGFTLIEILVVVAIIALLSSVALIGMLSAREKGRNVKRLSDMTQMNTGLELFFAANKGYPEDTSPQDGIPDALAPQFMTSIPKAPMPGDGICETLTHPTGAIDQPPANIPSNTYYYVPVGSPYVINGKTLYPDYYYYFCIGNETGGFPAGSRILTPRGVR